jgi:hypothetical protein
MKIASAAVLVFASMSLFGCASAPDDSASVASELAANAPRSTTECKLRYEYKDCAGTICQYFVDDLSVTSETFPSFERDLGTASNRYTAHVSALPKKTPTGESTTDGYFDLAVRDNATGQYYSGSSRVSLNDLASKPELFAGALTLDVTQFEDHGGPYDYVEVTCAIHAP